MNERDAKRERRKKSRQKRHERNTCKVNEFFQVIGLENNLLARTIESVEQMENEFPMLPALHYFFLTSSPKVENLIRSLSIKDRKQFMIEWWELVSKRPDFKSEFAVVDLAIELDTPEGTQFITKMYA